MSCACHRMTFCPDLICVGYDDDVPVFVRRDSPEGLAAAARHTVALCREEALIGQLEYAVGEIEKQARAFHIRSLDAKGTETRDAWSVGCDMLHQISNALAAAARQGGDGTAPAESPQSGDAKQRNAQRRSA